MDALILCGGFAKRLEPITLFVPKPLLPIGGRPIMDYLADSAVRAGATRLVLSTNRKFSDQFRYWAENRTASGFNKRIEIIVEPTMHDGEKFGAIKGISYTIEHAKLDNDLLIMAGDNFFTFNLARTINHFNKFRKPTIAVHDIKSLSDAVRFGVVEVDGHRVMAFHEKPSSPRSTLISTGIYVCPAEMLEKFSEYLKNGNNPDAPGYFIQWLMGNGEVHSVVYTEDWYDIGTIETYREVFDRRIRNGR